jgi:hypothetical protein
LSNTGVDVWHLFRQCGFPTFWRREWRR